MEPRFAIANFVVISIVMLFTFAYSLEAFYQIRETHRYIPPESFIDICRFVIGAAIFVLTMGGIAGIRKVTNKDDK